MNPLYENVCNALSELEDYILTSGSGYDSSMLAHWGWNCPALDVNDIAAIPRILRERIERENPQDIPDEYQKFIQNIPSKIVMMQQNTVPYLFNGSGVSAYPAFIALFDYIERVLNTNLLPLKTNVDWHEIKDKNLLPKSITLRLTGLHSKLAEIEPEIEKLKADIEVIKDARDAADMLPTSMQDLQSAQLKINDSVNKVTEKISGFQKEATELCMKINQSEAESTRLLASIQNQGIEADKVVAKCEEAYQITTTKGLAAAFDQRASALEKSMWVWVSGLVVALIIGAVVGADRVELLSNALNQKTPEWGVIMLHMVLSALSVGAPLWFAWMATKQIGHRFKLAEDYGFKASVAKAYEGYRKEASRLDVQLETRLFSSALSRLEEAPLRLIETQNHGSPAHELLASKAVSQVIDKLPDVKGAISETVDSVKSRVKRDKPNTDQE